MPSTPVLVLLTLAVNAVVTLAFPAYVTLNAAAFPSIPPKRAKQLLYVSLCIAATLGFTVLRISFVFEPLNVAIAIFCTAGAIVISYFAFKESSKKLQKLAALITLSVLLLGSLLMAFGELFENLSSETIDLTSSLVCQRSGYGMVASDSGTDVQISQHFGIVQRTVAHAHISDFSEGHIALEKPLMDCIAALEKKRDAMSTAVVH